MSTRQMRRRLAKVQEKISPGGDGTCTWEEFNRLLWQRDKQKYLAMVHEAGGDMSRSFVAQFEREDAERAAERQDGLSWNRSVM
jgi:hypothetical protein